jgi:Heparinase II/III-like protein
MPSSAPLDGSAEPEPATPAQRSARFSGPLARAWCGRADLSTLLAAPAHALPVPPATNRPVWTSLEPTTLAELRTRASADLGAPWPIPLPREYALYFREGHRDTYEQSVFARQRRLSRAAVVAAVTEDPLWIDEVLDGVTLLCEQSSWCWPAHDDTRRVHGAVVPTVTDPYLDLGAGEVAGQLAWLDHLLGEALDAHAPGLRARIRYEVDRRVLTPFTARRDWHWLGLDGDVHNWNPWIHGNVLVAALSLVDDAPRRASVVELVIEGIDRYVAVLPADGAIDEGFSYWWNGACRAIEALEILAHATGGALDATGIPALRETVAFPHRVHLGDGWYLNLADGQARASVEQPWHALFRAAQRIGDAQARAHAAAHRRPDEPVAHEEQGLGRLLRALTDADWRDAVPEPAPLPRDVWFASTQVLLARNEAGSAAGLTLAAKGGHNGEHHNHNDVGSVVVALGGVPVLIDAGRPTYTAQTFGPDRYEIWTMQSSWHNVPEIRGTAQRDGAKFAAREVTATVDDSAATLALDLAAAYPRDDIRHWRRTAQLDRSTGRVRVTDAWELADADGEGPTTVRWLVAGEVLVEPGRAEITARHGAGTLVLTWEPVDAPGLVSERVLDDPMLSDVWGDQLTRLDIDVSRSEPSGTLVLNVEERR